MVANLNVGTSTQAFTVDSPAFSVPDDVLFDSNDASFLDDPELDLRAYTSSSFGFEVSSSNPSYFTFDLEGDTYHFINSLALSQTAIAIIILWLLRLLGAKFLESISVSAMIYLALERILSEG